MSKHLLRTKILTTILIVLFVITPIGLSLSTVMHVQRVEAGVDLGELGKGFVVGAAACFATAFIMKYVSALIAIIPGPGVPATTAEEAVKKAIDCILYMVINTIIEDMIKSITVWAQSGFEGNPVFVTQVDKYMLSVLDTVAGAYIEEHLPLLCSPFRLDVQLALMQSYQTSSGRWRGSCSLTGAINNVEGFLGGNFYDGGWGGWVSLTTNPYNNPYGSYLEADMGMKIALLSASEKQKTDILQGRGYLSKQVKDCYIPLPEGEMGPPAPAEEGAAGAVCGEPRTVTPGSYIQEQVAEATGMSMDRLTFADELNEMVSALVAYLVRDVLLGEKGLAGYDPADFADNEYPELPSVDQIDIPGLDGGGGGGQCTPIQPSAGERGAREEININRFAASDEEPGSYTTIGVPEGRNYSRVQVEFDVTVGPFNGPGGQYNIFWLQRGPSHSNFEWGANDVIEVVANLNNPGNQNVRLATSVNICTQLDDGARNPFREGETYHVTIDYNPAGTNRMSAYIDGPGDNDAYLEQDATVDMLQSTDQKGRGGFFFVLGGMGSASAQEGTTGIGWVWENVNVVFTPGDSTGGGGGETTTAPTATITASPSTVNSGSPATLSWNSTNATSCTATSGSGFVTSGATSGTDTSDNLTTATTFGLRCTGAGGTATASVLVNTNTSQAARIFIDDRDTPNKNELYSESSSGVITKISQTLGAEGDVFRFEQTPDGQHVVYLADVQNDRAELFVVPSAGGTVTKISSPSTVFSDGTSSDVIRFTISPNGQRVAYTADPNEWTKYELYSVTLTGRDVVRISHQLPFDYDVDDFRFTPDSQRTLYRAGRTSIGLWELYSTPSSRAGAIRISQEMSTGESVAQNGFEVSCNSQTTYFLADLIGGALPILYSAPTNGGVITEVGGGQLPGNICS